MAAGGEDSIQEALALYDRAFSDYQCAKLWPGYLETLESSLDVSKHLDIPERGVRVGEMGHVFADVVFCILRGCRVVLP